MTSILSNQKLDASIRLRGHELSARKLAFWSTLATLLTALLCGVVGLFTTTVLFQAAVLFGMSTSLGYFVITSYESKEDMTEITKALNGASDASQEALIQMAKEFGKLTPIPVPDHVFRHASHALGRRLGQGDWQRICLYAPVGVWMESEFKDPWLMDTTTALRRGQVKQCRGVYGLPPKSEAAAWHAHGERRLRNFIGTDHTELHYLPAEDIRHPGAARGQGIIILESAGNPADYTTIFLFMGDDPESRGGFMIEDQTIGKIMANWFDSQVFHGCSARYILRPLTETGGQTPAEYMEAKLAEISSKYPKLTD